MPLEAPSASPRHQMRPAQDPNKFRLFFCSLVAHHDVVDGRGTRVGQFRLDGDARDVVQRHGHRRRDRGR